MLVEGREFAFQAVLLASAMSRFGFTAARRVRIRE